MQSFIILISNSNIMKKVKTPKIKEEKILITYHYQEEKRKTSSFR